MKRYHAFIVLFLLLTPSLYISFCNYQQKREELLSDMNQALAKTLSMQKSVEISPDTIQNYLANLQIPLLRERSYLYYALDESENHAGLCSDSLSWSNGQERCEFRCYASFSPLSIWCHSDQQGALLLLMLAFGWTLFSIHYFRRQMTQVIARMGNMVLATDDRFYTAQGEPIHLTPMQEQLMKMFFHADGHSLSKQEICDALWPKKPDASETLYTLIKRLKPVIEQQAGLHIDSERGRDYVLKRH